MQLQFQSASSAVFLLLMHPGHENVDVRVPIFANHYDIFGIILFANN